MRTICWFVGMVIVIGSTYGDVELSGRLAVLGTEPPVTLAAVRVFGFPDQAWRGSTARSWETVPRGWWNLKGEAGAWTILFTGPSHFVRPVVLSESLVEGASNNHVKAQPRFDYTCFTDNSWDPKPAAGYWQPFVAQSRSVTHVGFKLATDGIDGPGPGSQTMLLSVHRCKEDSPSNWPQVGPTVKVLQVDCGGAKQYYYSAGWHSGEVPLIAGQRYAVQLRPAKKGNQLQAFWEPTRPDSGAVVREGLDGTMQVTGQRLWMTIAGDGDELLIPCNKRVHREFGRFGGYATRWTQSWKAQGKSLAAVTLYLATSGTQPRMEEQRIAVRIRQGDPDGPIISPEKLGAANANYTGDACWGVLGVVYDKKKVPLIPGDRYCVEFTTLETPDSIGDFVNFKKQKNDRKPGFNPYLRPEEDSFDQGEAWKLGTERIEDDLDIQVVEYVD